MVGRNEGLEECLMLSEKDKDQLYEEIDAQLGFDIHFTSGLAWEEFVEEWKNSRKLFVADEPIEVCVALVTNSKKGESEDTREDVGDSNANV
ncbi:hypothetical protein PVK06_017131 [Gossypium arboreum]|uniref:Uncharacterized protein n=1 Tax=Gossypium arboreum TaxID=29729 RepID=A0ABR0Q2D2_GOSAR|nr:hypothetical protein PVK06_017131 [Gossypium arboreum]